MLAVRQAWSHSSRQTNACGYGSPRARGRQMRSTIRCKTTGFRDGNSPHLPPSNPAPSNIGPRLLAVGILVHRRGPDLAVDATADPRAGRARRVPGRDRADLARRKAIAPARVDRLVMFSNMPAARRGLIRGVHGDHNHHGCADRQCQKPDCRGAHLSLPSSVMDSPNILITEVRSSHAIRTRLSIGIVADRRRPYLAIDATGVARADLACSAPRGSHGTNFVRGPGTPQ